jgi:hypothetical protein
MAAPRNPSLEMRRDNASNRRSRSTPEERSAMMRNPLPKTICFISYAAVTSGVDVNRGLPFHNPNPSSHHLKMILLVLGTENVSHKHSRPGLFSLVLGALADRMQRTCRHCACSIGSGTLSTVQRRDSTW